MENTSKSSESLVESSTEEESFERTEMAGKTTKRDILSTIKNEHAKDYIGAGSGVMFCYRQMSLSRDRKEKPFDLAGLAWRTSLDIAEAYGWQALGTVHHQIDDWGGEYLLSDDQTVTDEDASNIAEALSKAVADRFQQLSGTCLEYVLKDTQGSAKFLEGLMSYLKRGSFQIGDG
jgi:hypothetical protein